MTSHKMNFLRLWDGRVCLEQPEKAIYLLKIETLL